MQTTIEEQNEEEMLRALHREINGLTRRTNVRPGAIDAAGGRKRRPKADHAAGDDKRPKHAALTMSEAGSARTEDAGHHKHRGHHAAGEQAGPGPWRKESVTSDDQSYARQRHGRVGLPHGQDLRPEYAEPSAAAALLARQKALEQSAKRPKCFVAGSLWGVNVPPAALQSKVALADAVRRACPDFVDATSALHVVLVNSSGTIKECPVNCHTCSRPGASWACCQGQDITRLYVASKVA